MCKNNCNFEKLSLGTAKFYFEFLKTCLFDARFLIIVKSESALEIFCNFFAELNLDESAGRLRAESGLSDKLWLDDSIDSMLDY